MNLFTRFRRCLRNSPVFLAGFLLATGLMLILAVQGAHDTGIFELDGNANGSGPGFHDDWEEIYDEWNDSSGNPETDIFAFIAQATEAPDVDVSYFKGGGSKDVNDVDEWLWEVTDVTPDKDDILNAFAAAYVLEEDICYLGGALADCATGGSQVVHDEGDIMIYFGMDRFDNSGSAEVAFWFFGQDVALVSDDETNTGGSFTGVHTDHDILVLSDFVIGGKISDVDVYRWDPNVKKNLDLISASGGDCLDAAAGDYACGTVSQSPAPMSPWPITPKDLPDGYHSPGLFYEGGINYTKLIGADNVGCLSSFMAETRSSHSEDAQLKDFALGNFPFCDISITKEGPPLAKVGDDVTYEYTIENNGAITLYLTSVIDDVVGDLTSDAEGAGCGTLASGGSCYFEVTTTIGASNAGGGEDTAVTNVVEAIYNSASDDSGDSVMDDDDHMVNLFEPSISFDKTGDGGPSKVGDTVNYILTLNNTSSSDSPDLDCNIVDGLLGIDEDVMLASGANHVINKGYVVPQDPSDPLLNIAYVTCSPLGFTNLLMDNDNHSVDLFQPAIDVDKTGDELSKVGDSVDYTITLSNNSSAGTPALNCVANDSLMGEVFNGVLPAGDTVLTPSYTVQQGDPDPLVNTVTLTCSPDGFPNILEASDGHSTNLFQPGFNLTLACDVFGVVAGQDVVYRATLNNTSSADTPDLLPNEGASSRTIEFDPPIGANVPITVSAYDPLPTLSYGDSLQVTFRGASTTAGDFIGTLFAQYEVDGFGNVLTDSDFATCNAAPAIGRIFIEKLMLDSEDYDFDFPVEIDSVPVTTISLFPEFNSADKVLSPIPPLPNFDNTVNGFDRQNSALEIDVGTVSDTQDVVIDETPVQAGTRFVSLECTDGTSDPATYNGTEATITVGFDDDITCRWVNEALFEIDLLKTFNGLVNSAVDQPFAIYEGPDGFGGSAIASDNTLGDGDGLLEFGNIQLASHQVFTFCELGIPVGTTSMWWVDTGGGLMAVTPYNPDSPIEDLGNRCIDFGNLADDFAAGEVEVGPGDTLHVVIDNVTPQGDARTPGYWKNWSSCSNGKQFEKAAAEYEANGAGNFGSEPPRHISLDEALYMSKFVGLLELNGDLDDGNPYNGTNEADCDEAVLILSHRDLSGKNQASDPAAKLARSLLAYLLNIEAGAGTCTAAENAAADGQSLLDSIGFDGDNGYFGKGKAAKDDPLYHEAIELAGILDTYNNNNLCP